MRLILRHVIRIHFVLALFLLPWLAWSGAVVFAEDENGFAEVTGAGFDDLFRVALVWGDFDNDGWLDVAVTGTTSEGGVSRIYRNNGDGTFTDIEAGLPSVSSGALAWGDFNNNGQLDLAVSGTLSFSTNRIARIYRNNGDGTFTDIEAGLPGVSSGALAWGDFNNNGWLDLALCGRVSFSDEITRIYRNNGDGTFTDIEAGLPGVSGNALAWGDFDGDGYLDLALSGQSIWGPITRLYRNHGDGIFVDAEADLLGLASASLAWGDFDGDGHLDLAVVGTTAGTGGRTTRIYHNLGDGSFAQYATLVGMTGGAVRWGDASSNGQPDLLITGQRSTGPATLLFSMEDGVFTEKPVALTDVMQSAAAWGDYNNNGRLDLLLAGNSNNDPNLPDAVTILYENTSSDTNTPPLPPADDLAVSFADSTLTLSWGAGSDAETAAPGLSYNLRMGTEPGSNDVFSGMADPVTGQRRIAAAGPHKATHLPVQGLESGATYYWAVQSIDSAFAGSAWSEEQQLTFHTIRGRITRTDGHPPPPTDVVANNEGGSTVTDPDGFFEVMVPAGWSGRLIPSLDRWLFEPARREYVNVQQDLEGQDFVAIPPVWEGVTVEALADTPMFTSLAVGDVNHNGRMDLVHAGRYLDGGIAYPRIRLNSNVGRRSFVGETIRDNTDGFVAFGDYNNSGYLDLALVRVHIDTFSHGTVILENTDGEHFAPTYGPSSVGIGSVAWGDFNNDGLSDVATAGRTGISQMGLFVAENRYPLQWSTRYSNIANFDSMSRLAWADYDNDGDLDLLYTSYNPNQTRMLRNDGAGGFTVEDVGLVDLRHGIAYAWGDYNNNGWLDLAISGSLGGSERITRIYRNNGDGTFSDIEAGLPGVSGGSLAWGDFNNNGLPDLAMMGWGPDGPLTRIYRNDGDDVFTDIGADLVQLSSGQLAWADFDNDGRLDLVVSGKDALGRCKFKVYYNNHDIPPNTPPSPPTPLLAELTDELTVTFSWTPGSDAETPAAGLSYNLRVGTEPGGSDIFSGLADADGWRRIPALGNAQKMTSWTLNSLPFGTLYWAVQSIDSAWAGSAWSEEQSFELIDTRPPVTVESIKREIDGASVHIEGALVSATLGDFFYIQDDTLPIGIRVQRVDHSAVAGQRVDVVGTLTTTTDGERQINATSVDVVEGSGHVHRWALANVLLGGSDWHYDPDTGAGQRGVLNGTGENTIGLRVRIWGEVTRTGSGYLYVDDGAGLLDGTLTGGQPNVGVRVIGNPAGLMDGDFLEINGISSCFHNEENVLRRVLTLDVGGLQEVPNTSPMGVPLSWYLTHGIVPRSGPDWEHDWGDVDGYDTDGDGMLNWQEHVADTDPTDSTCVFRSVGLDAGPPPTIGFESSAERIYTLLGRSNLVDGVWQPVPGAGPRQGAGGADSFTDDNEPPRGPFYRLKVELP